MKTGKTLTELAQQLETNRDAKTDYVMDTREIVMTPEESQIVVGGGQNVALNPTGHCHNQIAAYTGIGTRYYNKMLEESPALLAGNVNHWLHVDSEKENRRMVRTMDNVARAFLSDAYLRVDNEHIAEVALRAFELADDIKIASCEVTDKKLYIKAVFPRTQTEVKVGDAVQSGVIVSNGEIGNGRMRVDPFWLRLWCLNGCASMVKETGFSRIHRGSKIQNDGVVYQQDTLDAVVQSTLLQMRDAVTTFADPKWFETHVEAIRRTTETKAVEKPIEAVKVLAKTVGLLEAESDSILERLIRGGDYTQYGMLNAVTNLANDTESYDRATELEYIGGQILDLPASQWTRIAEAA